MTRQDSPHHVEPKTGFFRTVRVVCCYLPALLTLSMARVVPYAGNQPRLDAPAVSVCATIDPPFAGIGFSRTFRSQAKPSCVAPGLSSSFQIYADRLAEADLKMKRLRECHQLDHTPHQTAQIDRALEKAQADWIVLFDNAPDGFERTLYYKTYEKALACPKQAELRSHR